MTRSGDKERMERKKKKEQPALQSSILHLSEGDSFPSGRMAQAGRGP